MPRRPQGWRDEPARHSLASRGVKTSGLRSNARILPIYRFRSERYYRDDRLREFRNVDNPHEVIPFDCYEGRVLQMKASGEPIVLGIKGRGSFDGDVQITLEGAEELLPLLQSRGIRMQALSAFNSTSGTQKIEGRIKGVDVDLKVTHPGEDLYHVEGDMFYHIDRTFTRKELKGFYEKAKGLM